MSRSRRLALILIAVFLLAVAVGALLPRALEYEHRSIEGTLGVTTYARLPSLSGAGPWIQGFATDDSLHGHVALVVLWADTNPMALEALPEVESWRRAYSRYGLRLVGIQVPEFSFDADTAVVARAVRRLGIGFPIVCDPSYRVAERFHRTLERPAFYLADPIGRVIYESGGNHTAQVERALRRALAQAHPRAGIPFDALPETAPAESEPREHVVYLGTARVQAGPIAGSEPGRAQTFTAQFNFQEEGSPFVPYPVGRWTPGAEALSAERGGPDTYLSMRGTGTVWAVLAPPPGARARVWILKGPGWLSRDEAGADVQFEGHGDSYVEVTEPRVYAIAHCTGSCVLKLSPDVAGVHFYSMVFQR